MQMIIKRLSKAAIYMEICPSKKTVDMGLRLGKNIGGWMGFFFPLPLPIPFLGKYSPPGYDT